MDTYTITPSWKVPSRTLNVDIIIIGQKGFCFEYCLRKYKYIFVHYLPYKHTIVFGNFFTLLPLGFQGVSMLEKVCGEKMSPLFVLLVSLLGGQQWPLSTLTSGSMLLFDSINGSPVPTISVVPIVWNFDAWCTFLFSPLYQSLV